MAIALNDRSHPAGRLFLKAFDAPNLLSLDAPLIAVTWQGTLAAIFTSPQTGNPADAMPPGSANLLVLFLTVWLIYTADRLLDGWRLDFSRNVPLRHHFAAKHSRLLWPIWFAVLAITTALSITCLAPEVLGWGVGLMIVVSMYCCVVHGCGWLRRAVPKEWIVGTVFATGVSLPAFCDNASIPLVLSVALLAGLFVLNCLCVAKVQELSDRQQGIGSAVQMFPWVASRLPQLGTGLSATAIALGASGVIPVAIASSVTLSALGLTWIAWRIDKQRGFAEVDRLGGLADYALLSPWIVLATGIGG